MTVCLRPRLRLRLLGDSKVQGDRPPVTTGGLLAVELGRRPVVQSTAEGGCATFAIHLEGSVAATRRQEINGVQCTPYLAH